MATTNTALYNKQIGAGASPVLPGVMEFGSKLRMVMIETTIAALGATADVLNLCALPVGSRLLPQISRITCESCGTTVTISVGDSSSSTRYMASNALGGSARDLLFSAFPGADAYVAAAVAASPADVVTLTSITIGTPTAAAKVRIILAYQIE